MFRQRAPVAAVVDARKPGTAGIADKEAALKSTAMERTAWILGVCAWPALAADASELFRCVTPAGAVSYQDAPCGYGSRLTKTIVVPAAEVDAGKAVDAGKSKAGGTSVRSGAARASSSKSSRTPKTDGRSRQRQACKDARTDRDRKLEASGLNRTFEQLRALDDRVRAICGDL